VPPLTEKSAAVQAVAEEDGRTEEEDRKIKAGRRGRRRFSTCSHRQSAYSFRTALTLQAAVQGDHKVLVGFTLSDLYAEAFTYKKGEKAGETGISLKARLLRIGWAKIDGEPLAIEQAA
jgi:hypothetical protein